ncbi:paraneoplastic antigen Ma3 homolog [Archocentrus centrarchus]|uniref:paraneoplastic antigen Ma3 homolog n=1 Tax=Archocentrus centrarchus TaxID=63155 RepID=UPI0011EA48CE|nr:paraneoplastic antigen Ma3 homolog [Archocentrus centrarchus]
MEVVKTQNVKVQNSVLVSGLSNSEIDNEVFDFLKQFGPVNRLVEVHTTGTVKVIVEFQHEATAKELEKSYLPLDRPCTAKPEVIHHIQSLASAYSIESGASATATYLSELKDMALRSNRSFESILREELAKIGESLGGTIHADTVGHSVEEPLPSTETPPASSPVSPTSEHASVVHNDPHPITETVESQVPASLLSTPEVQRVIVEHIVKSSDIASTPNLPCKLKPFSGRVPHPTFETDYDTWRRSVEFCLTDPLLSETQIVRKIAESLAPPAANIVKSLGPKASPNTYLELLDSAYAAVEDGDELFARFLNTNQNVGEKPSDFLQRLHTALNLVVSRNGIAPGDANKQLLRQFCRGCWDSPLIASLQLEQRKNDPPQFAELLLLLRTEEDKQASKITRMKQHLGMQKPRVFSNMQSTCSSGRNGLEPAINDTSADLQKQITDLQTQIAQLKAEKTGQKSKRHPKGTKHKNKSQVESRETQQINVSMPKPKPGYCFRCGEDGHIASSCSNGHNPALVAIKRNAFKQKQREWEHHHKVSEHPDLN